MGEKLRDSQNRSIKGWVKPETQFTFQIDVTNLSSVELGALIWLLELEDNHYHRLGGGKPFGFGSARLEITSTALCQGSHWRDYYQDLGAAQPEAGDIATLKETFRQALEDAYDHTNAEGKTDADRILKSFKQMAKGFNDGLPIHYPRLASKTSKVYEWFVENEGKHGKKLALGELWNEPGLPYKPS